MVDQENSKKFYNWGGGERFLGMPLGNYTSQFFANIYLGRLDHFIKQKLKAKHYIRYVDDFLILHRSKEQLKQWKEKIEYFLNNQLKLNLHPQKTKIIPLERGIDFVGFRNYLHHKLPRKRNIKKMQDKISLFKEDLIDFKKLSEIHQGWQAHTNWANTYCLQNKIKDTIIQTIWDKI